MALHCPATLLVASPPEDEGSVRALAGRLTGERVLSVVTAPGEAHGALLAELLGAALETDAALVEGSEDEALLGVADLHRGETVVVLVGSPQEGRDLVRLEMGAGP